MIIHLYKPLFHFRSNVGAATFVFRYYGRSKSHSRLWSTEPQSTAFKIDRGVPDAGMTISRRPRYNAHWDRDADIYALQTPAAREIIKKVLGPRYARCDGFRAGRGTAYRKCELVTWRSAANGDHPSVVRLTWRSAYIIHVVRAKAWGDIGTNAELTTRGTE